MCIALRVWGFPFVTVPSPALLLPMLETECELETATKGGRRGSVVCAPEPGLAGQSSWEALLGALERRAEAGEAGWRSCSSPVGPGGPAWTALELSGARKWRLIPPHPAVCRARGNPKQLKIPDFPFWTGMREAQKRRGRVKRAQLHLFLTPLHPQPLGELPSPVSLGSIKDLAAADKPQIGTRAHLRPVAHLHCHSGVPAVPWHARPGMELCGR